MERSREVRRTTMAATNGVSRRRQRSTNSRDSHEEGEQIELQETVKLRDQAGKRDRDFSSRNKRRRGDRSNREEGEESTEESVGDEEYEVEDGGVSRTLPSNTSSSSNHNFRKSVTPSRFVKQAPAWKGTDEMIGVSVPRKARSASAKRSHETYETWVSGNGGSGEEQNLRQRSNSPLSSNVSVRKKMKPNGPKTSPPKVSKFSSSIQEDIEIEIAEVLYGLMKQSQSSKKPETTESSSQKLELKDTKGIDKDTKSSVSSPIANSAQMSLQTSILPRNNGPESDPLLGVVLRRKKVESENISTSNQTQSSSISCAVKVQTAQPAKTKVSSPELEKIPELTAKKFEAFINLGASQAVSESLETQQEDPKPVIKESGIGDKVATTEKPVTLKDESPPCSKLDVDIQDSTATKGSSSVPEVENQKEEKFKIDLMAPPPMASSPERDGLIDLVSDAKPVAQDVDMKMETSVKGEEKVERVVKKEAGVEEREEKKMESTAEKCEFPKLDLKKPGQDGEIVSGSKLQHKAIISKGKKNAQLPLPIAVAGCPGSLPPLGYMPPLQTVATMDGNTGSSTGLQPPQFLLSQPRSKRCATHHYIARNIYLHQQFTKMKPFWPAGAASATLYGAKPDNLNVLPSSNQLRGNFPGVNLKSAQDKGLAAATFPDCRGKDQSSEASKFMDTAQRKQLVFQQAPQPVPAGSLMNGPAFFFPLSQHQPAVAATGNLSGASKSATSTNNQSLSSKSVAGAVSFNYPNLAANEAPYLAILQNNGYPFPISTPVGSTPAIRGTPAQAMPFFNGSFYPSQMFQPSQLQQQQPQSQPLVQPAHHNTSTSSGSSSSHRQPETQQPRVSQVSGNKFLTSTSMQLQRSQKQRVPQSPQSRKLETEMSGENTPSVADTLTSHAQKRVYGQNLPPNFALMPSAMLGGTGGGGNHGEKQQQNSKGGVELIPSQVFAMSFASLNDNNTASTLNFSTMAQNPAIFQGLPDLARQVYKVVPAAQAAHQKNNQISEGKTGGNSANLEDGRKAISGKMPTSIGQTLVFDNSARSLNFMPSPVAGNWPSRSITPTAITTNTPIAASVLNSQQQQLLQLQKQHMLQQQLQQQQPTGAARSKAPTTDSQPSSSIATKFPNNPPVLSQTLFQSNSFTQSPQWRNSTRTPAQQQGRAPQGQTQISFGGSPKSALAAQGQQMPTNNQSPSPIVAGSPSNNGNLRTNSTGGKAGSSTYTLQSQQNENSSTGTGQKSSPVCGRNVPSILSTCPSHLSELKY